MSNQATHYPALKVGLCTPQSLDVQMREGTLGELKMTSLGQETREEKTATISRQSCHLISQLLGWFC